MNGKVQNKCRLECWYQHWYSAIASETNHWRLSYSTRICECFALKESSTTIPKRLQLLPDLLLVEMVKLLVLSSFHWSLTDCSGESAYFIDMSFPSTLEDLAPSIFRIGLFTLFEVFCSSQLFMSEDFSNEINLFFRKTFSLKT